VTWTPKKTLGGEEVVWQSKDTRDHKNPTDDADADGRFVAECLRRAGSTVREKG